MRQKVPKTESLRRQLKGQEDVQKILDQTRNSEAREGNSNARNKIYASKIILEATERMLRKELEDKDKYEEQINLVIKDYRRKTSMDQGRV